MVPCHILRKRMDYFYGPYNPVYSVKKCMQFEPLDPETAPTHNSVRWAKVLDLLKTMEPRSFRFMHESLMVCDNSPRKKLINDLIAARASADSREFFLKLEAPTS